MSRFRHSCKYNYRDVTLVVIMRRTARFSVCELPVQDTLQTFHYIFRDISHETATKISNQARAEGKERSNNLIYGEITNLTPFSFIFGFLSDRKEVLWGDETRVFVDLGSGTGRPVIAAALLHTFELCIGIEFVPDLFKASLRIKSLYENLLISSHDSSPSAPKVDFLCGSFLNKEVYNWVENGDVIFINSTCFDTPLMETIGSLASQMKRSSVVITLSYKLPVTAGFTLLMEERFEMSW